MTLRNLKRTAVLRWCLEGRRTLTLALPIMSGLVGQMLMGLTDTLMVGQVGTIPLAAAAFGHNLINVPLVGGMGLLAAVAVLAAQAYGAQQPAEAGQVLRHGLLISVLGGLGAAVFLTYFRSRAGWLNQPPEVVAAAQTYLLLTAWSLLPVMVGHALKQFSEALVHPWPPTLIMLGGVLLNIFLNWLLIFGHWGFPAMGLNGAGLATLLARIATTIVMVGYVLRAPSLARYLPTRWLARLSWPAIRAQLTLGTPVAAQHLLEVGAFVAAALMMGWINAEAMAAHQIAITCAATTFIFALGIGMAVSIRVGHAWGARARRRLRVVGFSGLAISGVLMGGFALLFIFGGNAIAHAFSRSPEVVGMAAAMLFIAGFFQIFDGFQVVAMCALRGMSDVRLPAVVAIISYWLVALPLAGLLGFVLDMGARGIWIGLAAGLATAAVILIWRFQGLTGIRSSADTAR
ncbi:MAG: MATE family efflux transporter [Verrucomicrobia bacterium]|nr:MATE family efflux transporter [Verrucomicrobiota bacterium]